MERVVAGSNVLLKWFILEEYSEYVKLMKNNHLLGRVEVVAFSYTLLEIYNASRKHHVKRIIGGEELSKIVELLHEAKITFTEIERRSLDKPLEYSLKNHVTVYNAYYIVLAHELETIAHTADEKLLKNLRDKEPRLKHIKEYKHGRI